jgi:hypothetical protein
MQQLARRIARLEVLYQSYKAGLLHMWKLPAESLEEACDRSAVDPADYPQVCVHVWHGGPTASPLATPPAPCWIPQTLPDIADLERRLLAGLRQATQGRSHG